MPGLTLRWMHGDTSNMRILLAGALASLLFSTNTGAQPATARSRDAAPYPPLRLAGPLPQAAVPQPPGPAAPGQPTAAPTTAAPTTAPSAATPPAADASAEALDSLAQQHYKSAVEMYQNHQFEAARIEFEAAYKLLPLPDLLHNLSMVAEQQGKLAEAVDYEERFLVAASHLMHSERAVARSRITQLQQTAKISGTTPTTSTAPTASAPAAPGVAVAPAAPAVAPASERRRTPAGALALLGIGGGVLLGGIGCGVGAILTQQSLEGGEPLYQREIDMLTQRGQALNIAAITLDVVGGVVIATGGIWAIWARTHATRAARP